MSLISMVPLLLFLSLLDGSASVAAANGASPSREYSSIIPPLNQSLPFPQPIIEQPACQAKCNVHLPDITVYEWQTYQATATVTVETVVKVVNPKYPGVTGTKHRFNNDVTVGELPMWQGGTLVSEVHVTGKTGEDTKVLEYPTPITEAGSEYWWDGVLATATAGRVACATEAARTIQFDAIQYDHIPQATMDMRVVHSAGAGNEQAEQGSLNVRVVSRVQPAKADMYRSLYPSEAAIASCKPIIDANRTYPTPTAPLYGTAYVTATVTSTVTNCRPDLMCNVHGEKTRTKLQGPETTGTVHKERESGTMQPMVAHGEKSATTLAGPSQVPALPVATGPAGGPASGPASGPVKLQPVSPAIPSVTGAVAIPQVDSSKGSFSLGHRVIPISMVMPIPAATNSEAKPLFAIAEGQVASLGQTFTVDSTPVVITNAPQGTSLVAIINAGEPTAEYAQIDDLVPTSGHFDAMPAQRHYFPITVGGETFEALNEHEFLMPDGQELSLGGKPVTIGPGDHKTVLSLVHGPGGSEVLVVDGVSKTLGSGERGFATPTDTPEGEFPVPDDSNHSSQGPSTEKSIPASGGSSTYEGMACKQRVGRLVVAFMVVIELLLVI